MRSDVKPPSTVPFRAPAPLKPGQKYWRLRHRRDVGEDANDAVRRAEKMPWWDSIADQRPAWSSGYWIWVGRAAIVLLLAACAAPVPVRPVERTSPSPWCIDAIVVFEGMQQGARLCVGSNEACEWTRKWLSRYAGRSKMVIAISPACTMEV